MSREGTARPAVADHGPTRGRFSYATEINIHKYNNAPVDVRKHVLPLVFDGTPRGASRSPSESPRRTASC